MDLMLDVIVDPDRAWHWKDEDELETFVERGVFAPELADRIRDEGLRVIARVEGNRPPFDEPWPAWRPDETWTAPELPHGWDRLCR
jgi:predicted RNA-binding protein associated with RNAse of E/G family